MLAPRESGPVRRAIEKNARQAQIVLRDEATAEAESLEPALSKERLIRGRRVYETETIDGVIQAVVRRQVRAESRQKCEQVLGRRELADVDLCGQKVVPKIPLAHRV